MQTKAGCRKHQGMGFHESWALGFRGLGLWGLGFRGLGNWGLGD